MKQFCSAIAAIALCASGTALAAGSQNPPPAQAPKTEAAKAPEGAKPTVKKP